MLLWGASAYLAALVPGGLAAATGKRLQSLRIAATAMAAAATAALLPLETATIAGDGTAALDPATLGAVLSTTSVGTAWLVEAGAAILLIAATAVPARHRAAATAAAAGLLLAGITFTGHAVMQAGSTGAMHRVNDALHVLSAGAWLGALVPLLPVLAALGDRTFQAEAAVALRRFSAAGHGAVALTIATGAVNTLLTLGHWPTDWSSPYQAMLAAKIGLAAAMVGLALVNRYVVGPRIETRRSWTIRALRRGTAIEIGLGLGAIGLVAVFGMLDPA